MVILGYAGLDLQDECDIKLEKGKGSGKIISVQLTCTTGVVVHAMSLAGRRDVRLERGFGHQP